MYCMQKCHADFFFDNFLELSCSLYCRRWSGERVSMNFLLHALIIIVNSGFRMPWISQSLYAPSWEPCQHRHPLLWQDKGSHHYSVAEVILRFEAGTFCEFSISMHTFYLISIDSVPRGESVSQRTSGQMQTSPHSSRILGQLLEPQRSLIFWFVSVLSQFRCVFLLFLCIFLSNVDNTGLCM